MRIQLRLHHLDMGFAQFPFPQNQKVHIFCQVLRHQIKAIRKDLIIKIKKGNVMKMKRIIEILNEIKPGESINESTRLIDDKIIEEFKLMVGALMKLINLLSCFAQNLILIQNRVI